MIDTSIPYYPLIMSKTDTDIYPKHSLPNGYEFVFYKEGDARKWAEIQTAVGSFGSVERGIEVFIRDFIENHPLSAEERVLFVRDEKGEYIATAALWDGDHFGSREQRIHWVAVHDAHSGKGIAKAMMTCLMELYRSLGYNGFIYLTTGTRNYPAVAIYERFGFKLYEETKSLFTDLDDEAFTKQNETAIKLVNTMLKR